jgi:hypothetical protein
MGLLDLKSVDRRRASFLPWRCFPAVRRQLRHPRLTANPPVPVLARLSRCQVLMYKEAICHHDTQCFAFSGSLFPGSGGRPALPVPSSAAISLFLNYPVTTARPLVRPA